MGNRNMIMKYSKYLALFFVFVITGGCISTTVKDFTDPDYRTFTSHSLLLDAPHQLFDEAFKSKLGDIDVKYSSTDSFFLPTREYTAEQKASLIQNSGFDTYLFIDIKGEEQSNRVVAYQTRSSSSAYNTGYGGAYASGSSTTVPITSHKRKTGAKATLYDVKTGRIIWVADLDTSARGSLYMSNSGTVYSMVKKVITSLLAKGHLKKKIN